MSYEGYEQYLCKNGHLWEDQSYFSGGKECPECKEEHVWSNMVDETNCDGIGYIPMEKLLVKEAVSKKCDMGHEHQTSPAIYRIPDVKETLSLRTYREEDSEGSLFSCETGKDTGLKMFA